jgi:hypothetical protein
VDILLIIISALALVIGFFFLSEATMGVGIIAIAGVLAIFARIAQADSHNLEVNNGIKRVHNLIAKTADPASESEPDTTEAKSSVDRGVDFLKQVPPDQDELLEMLAKEIEKKES